jgi:hypothetical protein
MFFWHRQTKAHGLLTGNSRVAALSCNSVVFQHYNTVIVEDSVPIETLIVKKHVLVEGFTKLHNEGNVLIVCYQQMYLMLI